MIGNSLYKEAEIGDHVKVAALLQDKESCFDENTKSQTLYIAASKGHLLVVQCLLEKWGAQMSNADKLLALWGASRNGALLVVQYFFRNCPELSMAEKELALFPAAEMGHLQIVTFLLNNFGDKISPITQGLALRLMEFGNKNNEVYYAISRHSVITPYVPAFATTQNSSALPLKESKPSLDSKRVNLG